MESFLEIKFLLRPLTQKRKNVTKLNSTKLSYLMSVYILIGGCSIYPEFVQTILYFGPVSDSEMVGLVAVTGIKIEFRCIFLTNSGCLWINF